MLSEKVGRNNPCPCGSGKKAKHCCWDDINNTVFIDKKALKKMPMENLDILIADLENDKYGKEYLMEKRSNGRNT